MDLTPSEVKKSDSEKSEANAEPVSRPKRPAGQDTESLVASLQGRLSAVVVCLSHAWGGLEQVAANDAAELAAKGLRVRMLCLKDSPVSGFLKDFHAIELIEIENAPRDFFDLYFRKLIRGWMEEGVNLIHTHQTTLLGSIVPWVFNQRKMVVIASRHIMNNHSKRNPFHAIIYRRLDALVVMSKALRQNVLSTHPLRERQVKVIHLGLDFERFDPDQVEADTFRKEWGADDDTLVIGIVGRLDPMKGQATFIRAAAGLSKRLRPGEKIKFVIVGEETRGAKSEYLSQLKEIVRELRIEEMVVFAGFKEDVPRVMRAFDIFVMPSKQEAFGLVAIEAMAMECPIVISRGGSAEEIVGQQEFGLLMRKEDAFDLQVQLRFLMDNPMLRVKMGQQARQHVKKHYDQKLRLRNTLDLYERSLRRFKL